MRRLPSLLTFAAFLSLVAVSGCSLFGSGGDDVDAYPESRAAISDAEFIETSGRIVRFSVTGRWPDTCGEFTRFESSRDGMTYRIAMYGRIEPGSQACGDGFIDITGEWSTTVPTEGTYTFRFQGRDDVALLERTVVVGGE